MRVITVYRPPQSLDGKTEPKTEKWKMATKSSENGKTGADLQIYEY